MTDFSYDEPDYGTPTRHIFFKGSAIEGEEAPDLEGRLHVIADGMLHPGVVLLHANPAGGGNMDMRVMLAIEAALARDGMATLRYNFRGVGGSGGWNLRAGGKRMGGPGGGGRTARRVLGPPLLRSSEG